MDSCSGVCVEGSDGRDLYSIYRGWVATLVCIRRVNRAITSWLVFYVACTSDIYTNVNCFGTLDINFVCTRRCVLVSTV